MTAPSYTMVHIRIREAWGPASDYPCVNCGGQAAQWSYDGQDADELRGANGHGTVMAYSVDWAKHYDPRCVRCHNAADHQYCPQGHDTDEVGRDTKGMCRECDRARDRAYQRSRRAAAKAAKIASEHAANASARSQRDPARQVASVSDASPPRGR